MNKDSGVLDEGCICHGNWRQLVKECEGLIGKEYVATDDGRTYVFFGLVNGGDDYYYGMLGNTTPHLRLLSCVGSLETWGFTLKD